jgi:Domain of unknown function (DUF222)
MPGPDDERPQPLAPEEAIPTPTPVPVDDAAAAAPVEDADLDFFAAPDDFFASGDFLAPGDFAVPGDADPALAEDVTLPGDGAGAEDVAPAEVWPQGLRWSWELDFGELLAALSEPAPWNRSGGPAPVPPVTPSDPARALGTAHVSGPDAAEADPVPAPGTPSEAGAGAGGVDRVEAEFAEMVAAVEAGRSRRVPLAVVAGRVAESLPAGPDLAAWLATGEAAGLEDGALVGVAASYRRLASWAQAGELAAVAQLAARSAAADEKIGMGGDGRPARLPVEACAQVSLGLTMSQAAASWWSDLAVALTWRLAATGAALRAGEIDLARARLIADATAVLDEDTARAVEAKVLPAAGDQTTGQLRACLRRAVIAADPEGAEQRREEAERRAKVSLYPDPDGTASLAGYSLPSVRAAAAMARIGALAKAMKAAGAGGGIDLLRAQVFLGLLLGTLPYIPPADGGPPDDPPGESPGDDPPDEPADPPASGGTPGNRFSARDQSPGRSNGRGTASRQGTAGPGHPESGNRESGRPPPGPGPAPPGPGPAPPGPGPAPPGPGPAPPGPGPAPPGPAPPGPAPPGPAPPGPAPPGSAPVGPAPADLTPSDPARPDADDRGLDGRPGGDDRTDAAKGGYRLVGSRLPPAWPQVLPVLPPGPAAMGNLPPAGGGLLDLVVPWSTLADDSGEPGQLTRIGAITPAQARHLAGLAAADLAVSWRVILTGPDGRATAVSRVRRLRDVPGGGPASLVRRVTVTISQDQVTQRRDLPVILQRTLAAAARAAENAKLQAIADAAAGGCAHALASSAYSPPPRLRDFITARDGTCRFPTCRQPVWRCDLDHCVPYHKGGKTCCCNLGGLCRFHHLIKQHHLWQLIQPAPGSFAWITPTGRTYYAQPDQHAA